MGASKITVGIKWFAYISGSIIAITTVCIIVGVLLEKIWGVNTLYGFYAVVARMFIVSLVLGTPFCVSGIYTINKSRKALGGKGQ